MGKRGILVAFEGLDKSGKTTQANLLTENLLMNNFPTEMWRYPNRTTEIGKLINSYLNKQIELDDHAIHLLFSANRWETVNQMKEKLNDGINIILDRYVYSGVAYTQAKNSTVFDVEWCKQCDKGLPKPDYVFFLNRNEIVNGCEERYESTEFQKKVYENFLKILKNEQNVTFLKESSIETVHKSIFNRIQSSMFQVQTHKLETIWN